MINGTAKRNAGIFRKTCMPVLVIGLVGCVALLSACDRTPDTIKIDVAQPLTGKRTERGQELLNGVNLAVANLNRNVSK